MWRTLSIAEHFWRKDNMIFQMTLGSSVISVMNYCRASFEIMTPIRQMAPLLYIINFSKLRFRVKNWTTLISAKNRADLSSISEEQCGPVFLAQPVYRAVETHNSTSTKCLPVQLIRICGDERFSPSVSAKVSGTTTTRSRSRLRQNAIAYTSPSRPERSRAHP